MKKRWLSAAVAVLLLTACADAAPISTTPATSAVPAATQTSVVDTEPTRPLVSTVTVTDAVAKDVVTGEHICHYHVPKLMINGLPIVSVNETMYNELYNGILENQVFSMEGNPTWSGMNYMWGENARTVSVVVYVKDELFTNLSSFSVYSVMKDSGTLVNDAASLYTAYGFTEETFRAQVKAAAETYYIMQYQPMMNDLGETAYREGLDATLEESVIGSAVPFINDSGDLCVVANIASFNGPDVYPVLLNVTGATEVSLPDVSMD